jgi:acid stress-induced BolA-like protein IbaG/YrbA
LNEVIPMETEAVAQLIRAGMPGAEVRVTGDGSHFEAVVVSEAFEEKSPIQKQRLVMDTVRPQIASGELHALSIKTFTPVEWAAANG